MVPLKICPGLQFPFYPPRPWRGSSLTPDSAGGVIDDDRWVIQPKLNGDRVIVVKLGGKIYAANRHGRFYSYTFDDSWLKKHLLDQTVLDGEVRGKRFFPFEAVAIAGDFQLARPVEDRVKLARQLVLEAGQPWLFSTPTLAEILAMIASSRSDNTWEGLVLKRRGSGYVPLGSPSQKTNSWMKQKWL